MTQIQTDECSTRVVYRAWPNGEVTALLLDVPANPGMVACYAHIGQHGEGQYYHVIGQTRPAREGEYAALHRELTTIGYELTVRQRRTVR
jgi:hypothetical protein